MSAYAIVQAIVACYLVGALVSAGREAVKSPGSREGEGIEKLYQGLRWPLRVLDQSFIDLGNALHSHSWTEIKSPGLLKQLGFSHVCSTCGELKGDK